MSHDWAGFWDHLSTHMGRRGAQVKQSIPYAAAATEAYLTKGMSLIRTMGTPAKQDLIKALSEMPAKGHKHTSAINMSYGKRRNTRSRRPAKRNNKGRKRSSRRRGKKTNTTLAVIKKALLGRMAY